MKKITYPVIEKSGDTSVKKEEEGGMNYLLLNLPDNSCQYWKPFSEIKELTDEIAKSRPLVINIRGAKKELKRLYGVHNRMLILGNYCDFMDSYRLASALEIKKYK